MGRNALIFTFILVLSCCFANAEYNTNQLPVLPNIKEQNQHNSLKTLSFFQRVKNFLGFGDQDNDSVVSIIEEDDDYLVVTEDNNDVAKEYSITSDINDDFNLSTTNPDNPDTVSNNIKEVDNNELLSKDKSPNSNNDDTDFSANMARFNDLDEEDILKLPPGFDETENNFDDLKNSFEELKGTSELEDLPTIEQNVTLKKKIDLDETISSKEQVEFYEKISPKDLILLEEKIASNKEVVSKGDIESKEDITFQKKITELKLGDDTDLSGELVMPSDLTKDSKDNIPNYIDIADSNLGSENLLNKYKDELQSKKLGTQKIEKIKPEQISSDNKKMEEFTEVTAADLNESQLNFANNEAQVLMLPNDDVVLGDLTQVAKNNLIDFKSYAKIFWTQYNKIKNESERYVIDKFINDYNENFYKEDDLYDEDDLAIKLGEALQSINNNNINDLIIILNNYPILQLETKEKNTLLHHAVLNGNYYATKLLVLKGINVFATNNNNQTALDIANNIGDKQIIFLLKSAGLK